MSMIRNALMREVISVVCVVILIMNAVINEISVSPIIS